MPDIIGMPWELAKDLLNQANIRYNSVITYPTKSFFPLKDNDITSLSRSIWMTES